MTGTTLSPDFPTTNGAFQTSPHGSVTSGYAFVTRFAPGGQSYAYSTYLGGGADSGRAIAIDSLGTAYVTGNTNSHVFPVTAGAFQKKLGNDMGGNAFFTVMKPDGSGLVYSTYLGGSGNSGAGFNRADVGVGIALDGSGGVYLTGAAASANFPVTSGAFQKTRKGPNNAFAAKFDFSGKLSVSPTKLAFGAVKASSGPVKKSFQVKNASSDSPLTVVVGNSSSAAFTVSAPAVNTFPEIHLSPGGSQAVTVTFTPVRGTSASCTIAVSGGVTTINLPVSGKGK